MISESIKALLAHVSETHIKNLRNEDQASTIEGLLKSEDDSLLNVRLEFEDGPFLYNIAIRSKQVKINSYAFLSIPKKAHKDDDNKTEVEDSPSKSEFEVDRNYVCKYCLKYFSRAETCRDHEITYHENSLKYNFECSICQQKFRTANGLKSHMNNKHSDKKPDLYKCKSCDKGYVNKTHLIRHCKVVGHEYPDQEKPSNEAFSVQCHICYKYVGRVEYHMKMYHSKDSNEFKCDHCDFVTKRKDNLLRHERNVHSLYNKRFSSIEKTFKNKKVNFKCPDCEMVFKSKSEVINHLSLQNCQELECKSCRKFFKLKQHLTRHNKKYHNL